MAVKKLHYGGTDEGHTRTVRLHTEEDKISAATMEILNDMEGVRLEDKGDRNYHLRITAKTPADRDHIENLAIAKLKKALNL